jgi:DNA-binding response OmpR family regulator
MSKQILIVEDDTSIRNLCRSKLEETGYTVSEAPNGVKASLWLDHNHPDLVITDVVMPEMDGIEFAYELRRKNSKVAILAISAGDAYTSKEMCLDLMKSLGAVDTLTKPFELDQLVAAVKNLIGQP